MKFLNIFLLTMGLVLGVSQSFAGTTPGGAGSPSEFPDGVTVTTGGVTVDAGDLTVTSGNSDLTGGNTSLSVPVNQTSSCPDGGNVCSGGPTTLTWSGTPTQSCILPNSRTAYWSRVGNTITFVTHGDIDGCSGINAFAGYMSLPVPGTIPVSGVSGMCHMNSGVAESYFALLYDGGNPNAIYVKFLTAYTITGSTGYTCHGTYNIN